MLIMTLLVAGALTWIVGHQAYSEIREIIRDSEKSGSSVIDVGLKKIDPFLSKIQSVFSLDSTAPHWLRSLPLGEQHADKIWNDFQDKTAHLKDDAIKLLTAALPALITKPNITVAAEHTSLALLESFLSLAIAVVLCVRGDNFANVIQDVAGNLGGNVARRAVMIAASAVRSVVYAVIGTALAQGVLLAGVFQFVGIGAVGLLGSVAFILSVTQVGQLVVLLTWVVAGVWVYYNGSSADLLIMIVGFCLALSFLIFLRRRIISGKLGIPGMLIFLGTLGGVLAFHLIGLFIGPTLIAVAYALLQDWRSWPNDGTTEQYDPSVA